MSRLVFKKIRKLETAAEIIATAITEGLAARQEVVWLTAGGSAVDLAVEVRERIAGAGNSILLSLTDERFGPVGHNESNWQKLLDAGFKFEGLSAHPILSGADIVKSTDDYEEFLKSSLTKNAYKIGLFGIGSDGHTAGILPRAAAIGSRRLAVAFIAADYMRITMTGGAIAKLDEAFVYAMGSEKHSQLERLTQAFDAGRQPAQLLKKVAKVTIFNDYLGEEI